MLPTLALSTISRESRMTNTNPSQASLILAELQRRPGVNVPMPDLVRVSGAFAVHSRVAELRKRGYQIENDIDHDPVSAAKHSYYRLVPLSSGEPSPDGIQQSPDAPYEVTQKCPVVTSASIELGNKAGTRPGRI
jgi:hypothetical protein